MDVDADAARTARAAAACPPVRRSSPPWRTKIGSVSMTSFSTRPGTADDLVDPAYAVLVDAEVHDEVDADAATVGTTNRAEMFSPASSGSVHIFTSASRALLAWIVHMPGQPGVEREQQVEALLGPHLADDDPGRPHPQRSP